MPRPRKTVQNICSDSEWKAMTNRMRACCPPPEGYSWRFVWSAVCGDEGVRGDCERRPAKGDGRGVFVIRVSKDMSEGETVDVLIHEVAHAYDSWHHHSWGGDHSDTFWIWVGRVYRRFWALTTG